MKVSSGFSKWLAMCCIVLCTGCAAQRAATAPASGGTQKYRTHIFRESMEISGITLLKAQDGVQRGTVINEFGIKAFDFENTARHCRILQAAGPIRRFPVRQMLARDLHFWMNGLDAGAAVTSGPRALTITPQGIEVKNSRTRLQYLFTPME